MFWNLSVISTTTKTKSEEPRDLTPEIVKIEDLIAMSEKIRVDLLERTGVDAKTTSRVLTSTTRDALGQSTLSDEEYARNLSDFYKHKLYGNGLGTTSGWGVNEAIYQLDKGLDESYGFSPDALDGYLTTPRGILAKSGNPSPTVALSVGYYLNDDQNWAVEALVLGAPLRVTIQGAGVNDEGTPNQLAGNDIINTKMLPPLLKFGYYFGDRTWVVRPYVGVAAMYSIFFDTKSTSYFEKYNGGKTSVSIGNKFAVGPMLGLESGDLSGWRVGLSVGRIKFSTEATLVTRGTMFRTGDLALKDYKRNVNDANGEAVKLGVYDAIEAAEDVLGAQDAAPPLLTGPMRFNAAWSASGRSTPSPGFMTEGFTTEMMKDLAAYKKANQGGDGTLGTFVRKQRSTLDNTIFMLSVGKSF
jgi:outer membrane protein W